MLWVSKSPLDEGTLHEPSLLGSDHPMTDVFCGFHSDLVIWLRPLRIGLWEVLPNGLLLRSLYMGVTTYWLGWSSRFICWTAAEDFFGCKAAYGWYFCFFLVGRRGQHVEKVDDDWGQIFLGYPWSGDLGHVDIPFWDLNDGTSKVTCDMKTSVFTTGFFRSLSWEKSEKTRASQY